MNVDFLYAKPETQQGSTDRHFGMELSYDYGFNTGSQFNGNISGIKWRSMGDGDYRSYGFAYDPSNRLLRADFNQRAWYNDWKKAVSSNLNINFSMYMGDGVNPGTGYDANGNLKTDANKSISNITYNYLNLPEQISVTGKGTITYTYDALGGKRSKTVTESGVSVTYKGQTYSGITITTDNYYENTWVYESKSYSDITLQNGLGYATKALFSGHEDGRIRPIYSNNTLTAFAGDYFIKDHLGNIRMVLTKNLLRNEGVNLVRNLHTC